MSESSKQKSSAQSAPRSSIYSQNSTSSQSPRDFLPQDDLKAQINTSPSPVTSAKDARSWLEGKGWLLNSEGPSSIKLADILLSVTLTFKLPAEASTAIRSVAFLLRDHADDSVSSTIADQLSNKLIDKINSPIIKLNEAFEATKSFLDAMTQKQAAELLTLQESTKQQADLAKSLAASSEKLSIASNPRNLSASAWPLLQVHPSPASPQSGSQAPSHRGNVHTDPKVIQ